MSRTDLSPGFWIDLDKFPDTEDDPRDKIIERLTTEVKKAADLLREGSKRFGEYGET